MTRSRRRRGRIAALTAILTAVPTLWLAAPAAQADPAPTLRPPTTRPTPAPPSYTGDATYTRYDDVTLS